MSEKIAIYAGSFDCIHSGHIEIIKRAVALFPTRIVHVIVADNRNKKHFFTADERYSIVEASLKELVGKIKIVKFDGIISNYANDNDADVMIRGIRDGVDLNYETALEQFTRNTSSAETVYLSPYTEHLNTSSSLIRMFLETDNVSEAKKYMDKDGFYTLTQILKNRS